MVNIGGFPWTRKFFLLSFFLSSCARTSQGALTARKQNERPSERESFRTALTHFEVSATLPIQT